MKVIQLHLFKALLSLLAGCLISACVGTTDFLTASILQRPQGHVKVKMDQDSNYIIQIYLKNLIRARELQPAKLSYVVWMVSDRGITKNIGNLKYSTNIFSNTLKSTFRPASPIKPVRIYITAEDDPGIQYSNTEIVFSTSTFRD